MRRIPLLILSALFCLSLAAQDNESLGPFVHRSPIHVLDVRELAYRIQNDTVFMSRSPLRAPDQADTAVNWIDRIEDMPTYYKTFYNKYINLANEVLSGNTNWLSDPTMGELDKDDFDSIEYYVPFKTWLFSVPFEYPKDITILRDILPYADKAIAEYVDKYEKELGLYFPYMSLSMDYDMPQAFWTSNGYYWRYYYSYNFPTPPSKGKGTARVTLKVNYIIKNSEYSIFESQFATTQAINDAVTEYNRIVKDILADMPKSSAYYKALYLNDWLTTHNCYSSAYASGNFNSIVWNPMSALRGTVGPDGPVCEGYSRAFKILANAAGIPAVLNVGRAISYQGNDPEPHMWNEVKMDDGKWYAVDVTWNDPGSYRGNVAKSGIENHIWFMLGKNSRNYGVRFIDSHPCSLLYDTQLTSRWYLSIKTLIADYAYDISSAIQSPQATPAATFKVHSLTGVNLGTYSTLEELRSTLSPGLYIINNRKTLLR